LFRVIKRDVSKTHLHSILLFNLLERTTIGGTMQVLDPAFNYDGLSSAQSNQGKLG